MRESERASECESVSAPTSACACASVCVYILKYCIVKLKIENIEIFTTIAQ